MRHGGSLFPAALARKRSRSLVISVLLALCTVAALASVAGASRQLAITRYARVEAVCPPPAPGDASCSAFARVNVPASEAGEPGVTAYTVPAGVAAAGTARPGVLTLGPAGGYTPADLASAYNYEDSSGGSGQTVAIVDAYNDPEIEGDLGKFDTNYGLSACTKANGCLTKVSQTGSTSVLPANDTTGWSVEISLDVEMVHSACPNCKILLVEANSSEFNDLAAAVNEAATLGATEISNSYGGVEEPGGGDEAAYNHPGIVIAAATGDYGYYDWTILNEVPWTELEDEFEEEGFTEAEFDEFVEEVLPPAAPNEPASLPTVVSTGGTTLELNGEGKRAHERVWNGNGPVDGDGFIEGASGGGCSTLFTAQPWQQHVPGWTATGCGTKRLNADVSADADPITGFDIFDSFNCGEECERFKRGKNWVTIGGTSLSTPLISSLYALAGGAHGVNYPALTLYGHLGESADVFDVSEGGNGLCDAAPLASCGHPDARGGLTKVFGPPFKGLRRDVDCEYTTACNATTGFDGPSGVGSPNGLGLFELRPLTAAIAPPSGVKAKIASTFSASGSSDPYPGASVSYAWEFGDGATESGVEPTHTYATAGKYTVTLKLSDSYGFNSTLASVVVDVTEPSAEEIKEAKEKAEKEAAEKKKAEEEAAKKKAEEEAAKKKAEEAAAKAQAEAAAKKRAEEEALAKAAASGSGGVSGVRSSLAPPIPDAELAGTSLQVSAAGAVTLKISCPAGESSCTGTVTLRTLSAVIATRAQAAKRKPAILTLASGSFSVAGGKVKTLTLHLSAAARVLLAHAHTLRSRVTLLAHDAAGARHTTETLVTLRAPAKRRK